MLTLYVQGAELFDEETSTFSNAEGLTLEFEHSLVSLSKWESKHEKPFLGNDDNRTGDEVFDYIKMMCLTPGVSEEIWNRLSEDNLKEIDTYINAKMTATWFNETPGSRPSRETITAELVYFWMSTFNIPLECENWHFNRLITVLRIHSVKNQKQKKMSRSDAAAQQRALNEQRRAQYGSNG